MSTHHQIPTSAPCSLPIININRYTTTKYTYFILIYQHPTQNQELIKFCDKIEDDLERILVVTNELRCWKPNIILEEEIVNQWFIINNQHLFKYFALWAAHAESVHLCSYISYFIFLLWSLFIVMDGSSNFVFCSSSLYLDEEIISWYKWSRLISDQIRRTSWSHSSWRRTKMLTTQNPFKHKIKEHTRPIFDIFAAHLSRDRVFGLK